jgi:3-deoxy-D-manno-octulosonic-acid transferase
MIILYNILQLFLCPLLLVFLFLPRNRPQNVRRLGVRFRCRPKQIGRRTFWVHAQSTSEITSSLALINGLKYEYPDAEVFFSTVNCESELQAKVILTDIVDHFILLPIDIRFVVNRFLRLIEPDLFILINAIPLPNILGCMKKKGIPTMLVNCKISAEANKSYKRFAYFFKPLFTSITTFCVQTDNDRQKLIELGVDKSRIHTLANLKFDTSTFSSGLQKQFFSFTLPENKYLIVAGSTHEGEEEIILHCFKTLQNEFPDIYLIITPHNHWRGAAIHLLANEMGLTANRRSQINVGGKDLFILDTFGELNDAYSCADIAFVGGSLVAKGGHNPIEPALCGIPVLFGRHMEKFFEISGELMHAGGAIMVRDQIELLSNLEALLRNPQWLHKKGTASRKYCQPKQNIVTRYLSVIKQLL